MALLCVCRHNVKRALKGSLLLHATIYFMLFVFAYYLYIGALEAEMAACPNGPMDEAALWAQAGRDQHTPEVMGNNRRLLQQPPAYKPVPWGDLPEGAQQVACSIEWGCQQSV